MNRNQFIDCFQLNNEATREEEIHHKVVAKRDTFIE